MLGRIRELIQELRNRSVFRALVAYAVVAWMLLQVADVTFDRLPLPESAMTVLIYVVVAGFPITLVLAWAYEFTGRGIVRHADTEGGAPRMAFAKFALIAVMVALGGAAGVHYAFQVFWEPPRRSIAVLPFANTGEAADTEYFSDGLTEEIQSLIIRLNEFRVIALSTTNQLKNTVMDAVTIANRLGAEAILVGSVRRYRNQVSVTARLIDGKDGGELWSDTYERELSDIYAIQEDIARQVARSLHVVLPIAAERRLKRLGTGNVEAYDAYLRGIDYLRKPPDEMSLRMAEGMLRQALALDPNYANAYAAMCEKDLAGYKLSRDADRFGSAERACRRALEIDDESIDVRLALAQLYQASGKNENALTEFEQVLHKNPSLADAHVGLALTYVAMDRHEEAEASLRRAIEADGSYWASFNAMGNFLFSEGRFDEAAEFYQMFLNRADDDAQALNNLGAAYYLSGNFKRAAEVWEESLAIKPTRSAYSNTGSMYFYLGEFQKAADRYSNAVNLAPNDYKMWGNLADAFYLIPEMKQAADVAYRRAIDLAEKQLAVNADDALILSSLAFYLSRTGESKRAGELARKALELGSGIMYVHYNCALTHAQLGDAEMALTELERAVQLNYQPKLISADPAFERYKNNDRFKRIVSESS